MRDLIAQIILTLALYYIGIAIMYYEGYKHGQHDRLHSIEEYKGMIEKVEWDIMGLSDWDPKFNNTKVLARIAQLFYNLKSQL